MQLTPIVIAALRAFGSPPARKRVAARTILWVVAGVLSAVGGIFALIGLHGLLAAHLQPVAASFVMALILLLAAGLLALGAWLAAPTQPAPRREEPDIALLLAGFLEGLAGRDDAAYRQPKGPADGNH